MLAGALLVSSCSTMDLGGAFPVPLTDPPKDIAVDLEVRPMPPKLNAGINLVPSKKDWWRTREGTNKLASTRTPQATHLWVYWCPSFQIWYKYLKGYTYIAASQNPPKHPPRTHSGRWLSFNCHPLPFKSLQAKPCHRTLDARGAMNTGFEQ